MKKLRFFVDNHKIQDGTPFVLEVDGEKLYASKVTFLLSTATEFDHNCERPNCFLTVRQPYELMWNSHHEVMVVPVRSEGESCTQ